MTGSMIKKIKQVELGRKGRISHQRKITVTLRTAQEEHEAEDCGVPFLDYLQYMLQENAKQAGNGL